MPKPLQMRALSGSDYEMYNLGGNRILAAYDLSTITTDLVLQGVGNFGGPAGADGMFRSTNSAYFHEYSGKDNNIVAICSSRSESKSYTDKPSSAPGLSRKGYFRR